LHYIGLWELAEIGQYINEPVDVRQDLRGYNMQPLPPDQRPQGISLSVGDLAKTICSTHRDVYFAKVQHIRPSRSERPWEAEAGTLIHTLLQEIHRFARTRLPIQGTDLNPESLFRRLKAYGIRRKNQMLARYRNDPRFAGGIWDNLDRHLDKILFFEVLLICSLVTYKASKKTVLSTGTNVNPAQEFEQLFDFSAIEQPISAPALGITDPATPDFVYAGRVIGDIKTGAFHDDTFEITCVAYALAYELEYKRNIDYGIILHVGFSPNHPFPIYQGSRLYKIDSLARSRFLLLRDQKLRVLRERTDPGSQADEPRCRPCPYHNRCWRP
jgi:CRISPR/Cas system-associated exonuclease Cas4 (RecB family)